MRAATVGEADGKLLGEKPCWWTGGSPCRWRRPGRVYIFGGGHVSQALVPVLAGVEFRPVVYDDRPEFADPALFPAAEETLCGGFPDLGSSRCTVTADDYVVIMTRGHQADYEVLTPGAPQRRPVSGVHRLPQEAGAVPGAAAGGWLHRGGVRPAPCPHRPCPSERRLRRRSLCPWRRR